MSTMTLGFPIINNRRRIPSGEVFVNGLLNDGSFFYGFSSRHVESSTDWSAAFDLPDDGAYFRVQRHLFEINILLDRMIIA